MRDVALARAYRAHGFGLGGVLLKQSLYPGRLLHRLLDGAGLVLDFGCGEGLLSNLLARTLPRTRFVGVDLDADKIAAANDCRTSPRTEFYGGDFFDHAFTDADAVIFNDVLHHLSPERQVRALQHAANCLNDNGLIILKEVNPADGWDVRHTRFWDTRLYPKDRLRFTAPAEWKSRFAAIGFRSLGSHVVRHPWVASRTMMWFTRRSKLARFTPPLPTALTTSVNTVLVTGATGFIGEWVARELLEKGLDGHPVRIDLIAREPLRVARDLANHPQVKLLAGDLTDETFVTNIEGHYSAVFHLAAAVDYFGGAKIYENNLRATNNLLSICARLKPSRLVFTSTMGALDRSRWDSSTTPLDENSPPHPTSPYGKAKVAEEALVRASTVDWTIVRIPWCYGPGMAESHHVRNLLNRVRTGALASRLNWPGRVSLVEVGQAARELVRSATNPRTLRETFFLADNEPLAVGRLFSAMGQTVGQMSAGAWHLPDWFWKLARLGLPLAPFPLKCLMSDALVVSTTKAQALGITLTRRDENFLVPLARYNATELHPLRHGSAALVTGAAGGIGACLARQLFARGYSLILADYNADALAARCRVHPGAMPWQIDLSDETLTEKLPGLFPHPFPWPAVIINNAGVGWRGHSWDASAAECRRIISVNATAPAVIANFFLHASPAPVVIVNTASTAAFQPLPYMAAYAAAKSFILSFSLALHAELRASQRRDFVITVVPGGTQTGFQSAAGVGTNPREKLLSPDEVAASILAAIERRRPFIYIGNRARAMSLAASLMPYPLQAFVWEKLMRKLR